MQKVVAVKCAGADLFKTMDSVDGDLVVDRTAGKPRHRRGSPLTDFPGFRVLSNIFGIWRADSGLVSCLQKEGMPGFDIEVTLEKLVSFR